MGSASSRKIVSNLGSPELGFTDPELDLIFKYFDKSGNGELDQKEADKFFNKVIKYAPNKQYQNVDRKAWFAALDTDGNGELSRNEMKKSAVTARREAKERAKEAEEAKIREQEKLAREEANRAEIERKEKEAEAARKAEDEAERLRLLKEAEKEAELKRIEEERIAEEKRLEQEKLAEAERLAEEARKAEEERLAAEERKAEEDHLRNLTGEGGPTPLAHLQLTELTPLAQPCIPSIHEETDNLRGPLAFFYVTHTAIRHLLTTLQETGNDVESIKTVFGNTNKLISAHVVQENKKFFPVLNKLDEFKDCIVAAKLLRTRFQDHQKREAVFTALEALDTADEAEIATVVTQLNEWVESHRALLDTEESITKPAATVASLNDYATLCKIVKAAIQDEDICEFQVPFVLKQLELQIKAAEAIEDDVKVFARAVKSIVSPNDWSQLLTNLNGSINEESHALVSSIV